MSGNHTTFQAYSLESHARKKFSSCYFMFVLYGMARYLIEVTSLHYFMN